MANIFQQQVVPDKPKVLAQERIYVYMPSASGDGKGLASFNQRDFSSPGGHASLRWPMEMLVEQLADPLVRPSLTKVMEDEFIHTSNPTTVTNPNTGVSYTSQNTEVKLNRENRDAIARPDLVMLNSRDFEALRVEGPNGEQFNQYQIKRKNPLAEATIFRVDNDDFSRRVEEGTNIVQVNWPYAYNQGEGTSKTNGYGLMRIAENSLGSLNYDAAGNLQVDTNAIKTQLADHLATRPTYGETDETNWVDRELYIDKVSGLAKRDAAGNTLLSITKEAVGLSNVENRTFASRTYDEFGTNMKQYFTNRFNSKLDKSVWDGPTGLFRDWAPPTDDRNTVQRWFMRLEEEDNSLWSSLKSMRLFLGFFDNRQDLEAVYQPEAIYFGCNAFIVQTTSYWAVRPIDSTRYQFVYRDNTGLETLIGQQLGDRAVNLNNGKEYVWSGTSWVYDGIHKDQWEWYNTAVQNLSFFDYVETEKAQLQPNAPVANVSVGISGKWIQSDHVHPSDPGKLDAWLIEDADITITTNPPDDNDFFLRLAKVTILDDQLNPIQATIVTTPQYLSQVSDPQVNDLAIARNNGQIYQYNGEEWIFTEKIGSITYDTGSTVNLPYIRTGQYLHNWKSSPTMFQQTEATNEYYWAGSKNEFEALNLADIPNGAFIHVDDGEELEPGYFATVDQIDVAGLRVTDDGVTSTERFVTIDRGVNLDGLPLQLVWENEIPHVKGERRKLAAFNFGNALPSPPAGHRMAITVPREGGGTTLAHRSFSANKIIQSNTQGNLAATSLNPSNLIVTSESSDTVTLSADRLVKATGNRTLESWSAGTIENRPIVATSSGDVKTLSLTSDRIIKTNANGGLQAVSWLEANLLKTNTETTDTTILTSGKVAITGTNNTINTWLSGGVAGSLIERGNVDGQIRVRTTVNTNRILVTGANGTVSELAAGTTGQYLVSSGTGTPGWVDGPSVPIHLPQTRLISNPSTSEANAYTGLVAVILASAPAVTDMRPNCIYYY